MFCPNCGNNCGESNFCSNCGTKLNVQNQTSTNPSNKIHPKSIYYVTVNGQKIDMIKVVGKYGCDTPGVYRHLKQKYGISKEQAEDILAPYVSMKEKNSPRKSLFSELVQSINEQSEIDASKKDAEKKRHMELDDSGQVYCPKCLSTSVSANKKGFGFVRGSLGASVGLDVGLIAGGIGSKKVICTCLKCGYQWKPGKK